MCPRHGLEMWLIVHTFYNGLTYNTRIYVDIAAGKVLINKNVNDTYHLIEDMAFNHSSGQMKASLKRRFQGSTMLML